MADVLYVMAMGHFHDHGAMEDLLERFERIYDTPVGTVSDLGPECGLDWTIAALSTDRPVRVLLPWAPFELGDVESIENVLDDLREGEFDYVHEGGPEEWKRRFCEWDLLKLSSAAVVFHDGGLTKQLRSCARLARWRANAVWGFDVRTYDLDEWCPSMTGLNQKPVGNDWPILSTKTPAPQRKRTP